jgi:cell wall-associated NlpC family hydrolase
MLTERHAPTPRRLRRSLAGLVLVGATLAPCVALDAVPVAAQERPAPDRLAAARQVAERRAAAHRHQSEIARERRAAVDAWIAAQARTDRLNAVIDKAATGLGRPYARGAVGPNAFDCSGFTRWAWQAAGVVLAHYSGAQWAASRHIAVEELQPGDLVFFWGPGERGDPGHVGLYVGDGQMIHAPGSGRSVRYDSIWYWSGARVAAGRVA